MMEVGAGPGPGSEAMRLPPLTSVVDALMRTVKDKDCLNKDALGW